MGNSVRVRFAPSPTGPLHIGGVRTALYNFLFARQKGGSFILRIEDTDRNRYVEGAEQYITESLKWCGLEFDESPDRGGPFAPYRQSERSDIYSKYIHKLIESGHAYFAFDTEEELDQRRESCKESKDIFTYDHHSRTYLINSLTLSRQETEHKLRSGVPYVIRVKIPENEKVIVNDLIRGEVVVETNNLDDKVLFKSDGLPTYHLANVVDDYLMKITHVIRGEEWLPSAPLHVLLYRFFGWEDSMPEFAHLPLILKPDGNGKLSKRDGDRLGFPVFPMAWKDPVSGEIFSGYRESGYLPEAFLNIMVHLGWNPGTDRELFTLTELTEEFSLHRVGKHGSKFDVEKARWFNHQYLQLSSDEDLYGYIQPYLREHSINPSKNLAVHILHLIKDRAFLIPDLWSQSWFFFIRPREFDNAVYQKIWKPDTAQTISDFCRELKEASVFNKEELQPFIQDFAARKSLKMGQLMNPLRLMAVGSNQGPGMIDIMLALGEEEFISRIEEGMLRLTSST